MLSQAATTLERSDSISKFHIMLHVHVITSHYATCTCYNIIICMFSKASLINYEQFLCTLCANIIQGELILFSSSFLMCVCVCVCVWGGGGGGRIQGNNKCNYQTQSTCPCRRQPYHHYDKQTSTTYRAASRKWI